MSRMDEVYNGLVEDANQNLTAIKDEYYRIRAGFTSDVFQDLLDVVSTKFKTNASFMNQVIQDELINPLERMFNTKVAEYKKDVTPTLEGYFGVAKNSTDKHDLLLATNKVESELTQDKYFAFDLESLIYEYCSSLYRTLGYRFGSINSRQVEFLVDDVCAESKSILIRAFGKVKDKINDLKVTSKDNFDKALDAVFTVLSNELNKKQFIPGYEEYKFIVDGTTVSYKYYNGDLIMIKDDQLITDVSNMETINRTIQEQFTENEFPGCTQVIDAMVRRIADIKMDEQMNDLRSDFIEEPKSTKVRPDIIMDGTEYTPSNASRFIDVPVAGSLLDDPDVDLPEGIIGNLEIDDLLAPPPVPVNPNASTNPEDIAITQEEIAALLGPDEEEPVVEETPMEPEVVKMGELQDRLEYLMKTPEVTEFLEIQEYFKKLNEAQERSLVSENARRFK